MTSGILYPSDLSGFSEANKHSIGALSPRVGRKSLNRLNKPSAHSKSRDPELFVETAPACEVKCFVKTNRVFGVVRESSIGAALLVDVMPSVIHDFGIAGDALSLDKVLLGGFRIEVAIRHGSIPPFSFNQKHVREKVERFLPRRQNLAQVKDHTIGQLKGVPVLAADGTFTIERPFSCGD